jgi:hypothetical protein
VSLGLGAEAFTVLALLEARDFASEAFHRVDGALNHFSETASKAAETAKVAGEGIDRSLLQTASGADAVDLAAARVDAAERKLAGAMEEQKVAEQGLLEARQAAAADDELAAAADRLAKAERAAGKAASDLGTAQKIQADTAKAAAAKNDEAAAAQTKVKNSSGALSNALSGVHKASGLVAAGMGFVGYEALKSAANFQSSSEQLVTSAGVNKNAIAGMRQQILQVSTDTGTAASKVVDDMYHIASAGLTGQKALDAMRAAAEGAKVGNADLDVVSKTLAGTLDSFSGNGMNANQMMNALIATVGTGDMRMQDLATSLGNVAPAAASAKLKFSELGGAIATMTSQNMTAQNATQDLNNLISHLQNPINTQITEMQALGLKSNDLAKNFGQRGLTGTLKILTDAILSHMGPAGSVLISTMRNSEQATANATQMIKSMPAPLAQLAEQFQKGAISYKEYTKGVQDLPAWMHKMGTQFADVEGKAHSFNDLLASGNPAAQTYNAALAKLTGGQTGLKTALMLSGDNAKMFNQNVAKVAAGTGKASDGVHGWSAVQGTMNQKLDQAKVSVQNTGIAIGTALLPAATALLTKVNAIVQPIAVWTQKHQELSKVLFGSVIGLAGTTFAVTSLAKAFKTVAAPITGTAHFIQGLTNAEKAASDATGIMGTAGGKLRKVFDGLKTAASGVAGQFGRVKQAISDMDLGGKAATMWQGISTGAQTAATAVKTFGSNAWNAAQTAGSMVVQLGKAAYGYTVLGIQAAASAIRIAAVTVAQWAVRAATAAWAAIQWVLDAALDANPIGLVIVAIAALAAGVIYAYTHFAVFRDIVNGIFNWFRGAIMTVIHFVEHNWKLLLPVLMLGPFGLILGAIWQYWGTIKKWFSDGINYIESATSRGISAVVGWFTGLPGQTMRVLSGLPGDMRTLGQNVIIGLWNGLVSMGNWLAGQLMNLIKDIIPGPIAKVLGISSPSKWAHWAGQMVGHGLANGILSTHGKVAAAAKTLTGAVTGTGGASLSATVGSLASGSAAGVAAAGRSGSGGGQVVMNFDLRGSTISSEADAEKLANKIGAIVATKMLPQGGVRIRM